MAERNFSVKEYMRRKGAAVQPRYRFRGVTQADFAAWKTALLAEVKAALGAMPNPVDLNPEIVWEQREDGILKQRVLLDVEEDMSAAAWVYIPETALKQPAAAILCNHGHGLFGKDSVMGIRNANYPEREDEIRQFNYDYGLQMAQRGYVTMAIDWRGFGERSDGGDPYPGRDKCNVFYIMGSLTGCNLLALDIFDGMRCIDYLTGLDCVAPERIGTMGLSFGGTMTTWIALMDERVKAADIICYSDRFSEFAMHYANFCGSQYVPGLFALADVCDLQGLIAPRPLLVEIGLHDQCFYAENALACARDVAKIYAAAGCAENFEVDQFARGHSFGGGKAFDFFAKHLGR